MLDGKKYWVLDTRTQQVLPGAYDNEYDAVMKASFLDSYLSEPRYVAVVEFDLGEKGEGREQG